MHGLKTKASWNENPSGTPVAYIKENTFTARGEPRLELGVHVFRIMWNYFGIH